MRKTKEARDAVPREPVSYLEKRGTIPAWGDPEPAPPKSRNPEDDVDLEDNENPDIPEHPDVPTNVSENPQEMEPEMVIRNSDDEMRDN